MRTQPSLGRLAAVLAIALALVIALSGGTAAAGTSEDTGYAGSTPPDVGLPEDEQPIDAGPTPPDVGLPPDSDQPDTDDDGPTASPGDDRSTDVSRLSSVGGEAGAASSGDGVTSVRDVPLARSGFPALALASLGCVSVLSGLCLVAVRRR